MLPPVGVRHQELPQTRVPGDGVPRPDAEWQSEQCLRLARVVQQLDVDPAAIALPRGEHDAAILAPGGNLGVDLGNQARVGTVDIGNVQHAAWWPVQPALGRRRGLLPRGDKQQPLTVWRPGDGQIRQGWGFGRVQIRQVAEAAVATQQTQRVQRASVRNEGNMLAVRAPGIGARHDRARQADELGRGQRSVGRQHEQSAAPRAVGHVAGGNRQRRVVRRTPAQVDQRLTGWRTPPRARRGVRLALLG